MTMYYKTLECIIRNTHVLLHIEVSKLIKPNIYLVFRSKRGAFQLWHEIYNDVSASLKGCQNDSVHDRNAVPPERKEK